MTSDCFVDTNVLLYLKDPKDPPKRARAGAWLDALSDAGRIAISPQVLNEFAHNIIRKFPHVGRAELVSNVEAMIPWCRVEMTGTITLHGLALHRRYRIAFDDATLIAAAIAAGCDFFLSEDLGHDTRLGSVRVVNPFLVEPISFLKAN